MFFRKQKAVGNDNEPRETAPTVIGRDTTFNGTIESDGEVHVDGTVRGSVSARVCHVGATGQIEGDVLADDVYVRGRVSGPIRGHHVHLQSGARVDGDIVNQTIMIDNGAQLNGAVWRSDNPLGQEQTAPGQPTLSTAASPLFASSLWNRENDDFRPLQAIRPKR